MKNIYLVLLLTIAMIYVNAQVRPEAYLSNLPSVPGDICSDETKGKDEFFSKVNEISGQLQTEMERRHENIEAKVEASKPKMQANVMKQTGVSPELIQQLQALEKQSKGASGDQKKAYDAQRKALADQMMQQSMNISMGEVENLKKMDKAGQRAWATAYVSEKQAEVMADPQKVKDQNAREMQKYNLLKSYKQLNDSLNAQQSRYMKKFAEIDENEDGRKLFAMIEGIRNEIREEYTKTTRTDQTLIELRSKLVAAKTSYCNLQSPRYIKVLAEYKSFIQSSMAAYYRLEKLSNEVTKMQNGVDLSPEPGEFGLGNVSGYIRQLLDAYKYNLYGPEDWTIG